MHHHSTVARHGMLPSYPLVFVPVWPQFWPAWCCSAQFLPAPALYQVAYQQGFDAARQSFAFRDEPHPN